MDFSKPYVVASYEQDEVIILGSYKTYQQADAAYDKFCEKFPYACIDIDDVRCMV